MPKTTAQRMREYRQRRAAASVKAPRAPPLTSTERSRLRRERLRGGNPERPTPLTSIERTESNSPQDNDSQMYSEEEEDGSADSFFNAFDFLDTVNINEVPEQPRKKFKACGVADRALLSFHSKNLVKQEMDAVDLLFLSHALTLKTFTKKRQMLTKMKISQIMMEAEMEELNDEPGSLSEQI